MSYPYLVQGSNITVVIGNKPHTISKTHITYQKVLDAIKANDWDTVKDIIEPKKVVLSYGKGNVSVQGETLYWKGEVLNSGLAVRMIQMLQEGFPIDPMVNFMENLYTNPSRRAVTELYGFLEKNNLPITPDGHFLAYKKVRDDYKDIHSGTMLNAPGCVVEMERNQVDDDKDRTCSAGLHFCSQSYLPRFGNGTSDRVVIVKINPADVVSIPSDYNDAKGRACRYEVIGEVGNDTDSTDKAFVKPVQSNAVNNTAVAPDVRTGPKLGTSEYTRGYTDGYNRSGNQLIGHEYGKGYWAGSQDKSAGVAMKYKFDAPGGTAVAREPVQSNAVNNTAKIEPKTGSTEFYRGYTDGFTDADYTPGVGYKNRNDYDEGYDKGQDDLRFGPGERYRYVQPAPKVVPRSGAWPFPNDRK